MISGALKPSHVRRSTSARNSVDRRAASRGCSSYARTGSVTSHRSGALLAAWLWRAFASARSTPARVVEDCEGCQLAGQPSRVRPLRAEKLPAASSHDAVGVNRRRFAAGRGRCGERGAGRWRVRRLPVEGPAIRVACAGYHPVACTGIGAGRGRPAAHRNCAARPQEVRASSVTVKREDHRSSRVGGCHGCAVTQRRRPGRAPPRQRRDRRADRQHAVRRIGVGLLRRIGAGVHQGGGRSTDLGELDVANRARVIRRSRWVAHSVVRVYRCDVRRAGRGVRLWNELDWTRAAVFLVITACVEPRAVSCCAAGLPPTVTQAAKSMF